MIEEKEIYYQCSICEKTLFVGESCDCLEYYLNEYNSFVFSEANDVSCEMDS